MSLQAAEYSAVSCGDWLPVRQYPCSSGMLAYCSRQSGLARAPRCGTSSPMMVRRTATSTFLPLIVYCNQQLTSVQTRKTPVMHTIVGLQSTKLIYCLNSKFYMIYCTCIIKLAFYDVCHFTRIYRYHNLGTSLDRDINV